MLLEMLPCGSTELSSCSDIAPQANSPTTNSLPPWGRAHPTRRVEYKGSLCAPVWDDAELPFQLRSSLWDYLAAQMLPLPTPASCFFL